jgi:hypothetical protein
MAKCRVIRYRGAFEEIRGIDIECTSQTFFFFAPSLTTDNLSTENESVKGTKTSSSAASSIGEIDFFGASKKPPTPLAPAHFNFRQLDAQ